MAEIKFIKGEPLAFRATTQFHIGDLEKTIKRDEIVYFDGQTVTIDEQEYKLSKFRTAIQAGWLVGAEDTDTVYRPKPAGVKVHAAESQGEFRTEAVEMATVQDEASVVTTHSTAHLGQRNGEEVKKTARGMAIQSDSINEDARPIAALSSPTKSLTVTNASAAAAEARRLDTSEVKRVAVKKAAAVVEDDRFSDDQLDALLGEDIASTPRPEPGLAGEGNDPHLTPAEREAKAKAAAERAEAARQERLAAAKADDAKRRVVVQQDAEVVANLNDSEESAEEEAADLADPALEQKLAMIRGLLPDFEWDLTAHWQTRVKLAVTQFGSNTPYLNAIKMIETDTVVEYIDRALARR